MVELPNTQILIEIIKVFNSANFCTTFFYRFTISKMTIYSPKKTDIYSVKLFTLAPCSVTYGLHWVFLPFFCLFFYHFFYFFNKPNAHRKIIIVIRYYIFL